LSRGLKWIGLSLGGLVAVALTFFVIGRNRLRREFVPPPGLTAVPGDSTTLARGEHLLRIYGCQECHGADLSGRVFADIPLGHFVAPNLTSGQGGRRGHLSRCGLGPRHSLWRAPRPPSCPSCPTASSTISVMPMPRP
jgi:hypothetical protein